MKVLATADIHGSQHRLNILLKNIDRYSPDLVVICGDITQFGPEELARNFLDQIPVETLAITGNIDTIDVGKGIDDSKATKIEMKRVVKKGIPFVGINGVDTNQFKIIEEKKLLDENSVLVSHVPPYGVQDKAFIGIHGGSKELKILVEKFKPKLVLCGHIHEDPGITKIGNTTVVNCSMGKRGEGALIEINDDINVKMI
ncbi:MAG: metallophosphoesterase family protein [Thermoplasmatales archaeon]|nr:metallophosphoesterase family protein [Thermoplasmatales archaeon]